MKEVAVHVICQCQHLLPSHNSQLHYTYSNVHVPSTLFRAAWGLPTSLPPPAMPIRGGGTVANPSPPPPPLLSPSPITNGVSFEHRHFGTCLGSFIVSLEGPNGLIEAVDGPKWSCSAVASVGAVKWVPGGSGRVMLFAWQRGDALRWAYVCVGLCAILCQANRVVQTCVYVDKALLKVKLSIYVVGELM